METHSGPSNTTLARVVTEEKGVVATASVATLGEVKESTVVVLADVLAEVAVKDFSENLLEMPIVL